MENWYIPSGIEGRALACVAEAWHIAKNTEIWPGWDLRKTPLALYKGDGSFFLSGHPHPPKGGREVFWPAGTTGPVVLHLATGTAPQPAAGAASACFYNGVWTAVIPLELVGETVEEALAFISLIWQEGFRAGVLSNGRAMSPPFISYYPVNKPVNNALGNIEGRLLRFARRTPEDAINELALGFALIRRERRAQLDDEIVSYEQETEYYDGLPAYVSALALQRLASETHDPCPAFLRMAGPDIRAKASRHLDARFSALERVNRRGLWARRQRFQLTGMGLAFLLDRIMPSWKERAVSPGVTLDALLEENVTFDGGSGDDSLIARIEMEFDYVQRLEEERAWAKEIEKMTRELLEGILSGQGLKLIFDISQLALTQAFFKEDHLHEVNEQLQVHTGPVTFHFGPTSLAFDGPPVIEDRRSGLLHVCLPVQRYRVEGDGSRFHLVKPAEFTEGLELNLGKVRVRAREGLIQPVDGALYIRITA